MAIIMDRISNYQEIREMNLDWKKELKKQLDKIGWELQGCGCEHYFLMDNKGRKSGLMFCYDRITADKIGKNTSISFYLKDCILEILDGPTLCIRGRIDESIFILCSSFF